MLAWSKFEATCEAIFADFSRTQSGLQPVLHNLVESLKMLRELPKRPVPIMALLALNPFVDCFDGGLHEYCVESVERRQFRKQNMC